MLSVSGDATRASCSVPPKPRRGQGEPVFYPPSSFGMKNTSDPGWTGW